MPRGSSALDRASSALNRKTSSSIGRKSALDSETSDDAAELNRFLTGLSQKAKAGANPSGRHSHMPAGLSDISISSDEDFKRVKMKPTAGPSVGGSKFLKTTKPTNVTNTATVAVPSKSLPSKSLTSSSALAAGQSPALLRLSEQAQRFMNKSNASVGSSLARKTNPLFMSEDSTIVSETTDSIGAKGTQFLKSKQVKPADDSRRFIKTPLPAASLRTSTEDDSDMAAYIHGLSPSASLVTDTEEVRATPMIALPRYSAKLAPAQSKPAKDDSSFATETFSAESSIVSARGHGLRTTEEFDSDIVTDSEGPLGRIVMDTTALSLEPARAPSSSTLPAKHKSTKSERSDKRQSARDGKLAPSAFSSLGLMSVDDLLPTAESPIRTTSPSIEDRSLQTESSIKSYKHSFNSESSIHTYKESVKTDSVPSEVRSHSTSKHDDYASDFDDTLRETESIHTDDVSTGHSRSYSRSPYSSQYSRSRSSSRTYSRSLSRSRSRSYTPTTRSFSDAYSRTRSKSRSRSSSRSRSRSRSLDRSWSQDRSRSRDTSRSRDLSKSVSRSRRRSGSPDLRSEQSSQLTSPDYTTSFEEHTESEKPTPAVQCLDAGVQTGLDLDEMILKYYWMSEQATPSFPSGVDSQGLFPDALPDPARISKMAISNEALEVLTTYNPAVLALNDMIRQQLDLSKEFLSMQRDLHKSIMSGIERDHRYTTLEDTKQFIESRRKPRLTFEEARRMVEEEMGL